MATDLIRYDLLVQDALRGVVRTVLGDVARNGLPGDHHLFITFRTGAPGLRLSDRMRERYPEEMTIILQHQFWDLSVNEHAFEVGLSFSNKPERLLIPFSAITTFQDPSVQFGLKFDIAEGTPAAEAGEEPAKAPPAKGKLVAVEASTADAAPPSAPAKLPAAKPAPAAAAPAEPAKAKLKAEGDDPTKVVSIDAFRKKP